MTVYPNMLQSVGCDAQLPAMPVLTAPWLLPKCAGEKRAESLGLGSEQSSLVSTYGRQHVEQ